MKIITLTGAAHVGGVLRYPRDGAIGPIDDDEAARLINAGDAIDVTADFATTEPASDAEPEIASAPDPETPAPPAPRPARGAAKPKE